MAPGFKFLRTRRSAGANLPSRFQRPSRVITREVTRNGSRLPQEGALMLLDHLKFGHRTIGPIAHIDVEGWGHAWLLQCGAHRGVGVAVWSSVRRLRVIIVFLR